MGRCDQRYQYFLMWVLCDINAAYVSFIQLFNPQYDINSTPLGVLSSNQGNVIARNQPMKALGIKMGEPHFRIKELIQSSNGHVWGRNFTLFGRIDSTMAPNPKSYALHIKNTLAKNLGIGVGVGVAHTKTLAKLASHAAKLNEWKAKTNGVAVLDTPLKVDWVLQRVKTRDVWGVGSKTAEKLSSLGITSGLELKNFNLVEAKRKFGVVLSRTIQELNGVNAVELKDLNEGRDSICVSKSMGKTDVFRSSQPQLSKSIQVNLPFHCADCDVLIKYAMFGLSQIYQEGYLFKKVGVIFNQLLSKNDHQQLNLFVDSGISHVNKKTTVSDEINSKFGNNVIRFGVQGFKQEWKPKDDLAPKSYTTNLKELPVALAK